MREADMGRRLADKLVQVWRLDGEETWVLIHIEVQSQEESGLAQRMLTYHERLLDRYKRPTWHPSHYTSALWGRSRTFPSPTITTTRPGPPHRAGAARGPASAQESHACRGRAPL